MTDKKYLKRVNMVKIATVYGGWVEAIIILPDDFSIPVGTTFKVEMEAPLGLIDSETESD